jgi:hypothetical protein
MAHESNESISYLLALKQSIASEAAASAPATKTDSSNAGDGNASPEQQFQGAEKRRSPRYKGEGTAEIREDGRDVRTWATFSDISLHGCYLEAQATYPSGTTLHMKLKANGIVLETKGKVRVTYPYLGMGIAFEGISDENQALLRRLLATISHPCVIMGPGIASSIPLNQQPGRNRPRRHQSPGRDPGSRRIL